MKIARKNKKKKQREFCSVPVCVSETNDLSKLRIAPNKHRKRVKSTTCLSDNKQNVQIIIIIVRVR